MRGEAGLCDPASDGATVWMRAEKRAGVTNGQPAAARREQPADGTR